MTSSCTRGRVQMSVQSAKHTNLCVVCAERSSGVCALDGERNRSHRRAQLHSRAPQPHPLRRAARTGERPRPHPAHSSGHVTNRGTCVAGARPAVAAAVHAGTGHFSGRGGSERELGGSRGGSVRPSQLRSGAHLIRTHLVWDAVRKRDRKRLSLPFPVDVPVVPSDVPARLSGLFCSLTDRKKNIHMQHKCTKSACE